MEQKLTEKQKEAVEKLGVIHEAMGLSPASARVDALLIVADKLDLTFEEIRESLELSKSAASNAINNLLILKRIGFKTKPGDRKRYFHTKLGHWKNSFKENVSALTDYKLAIAEIVSERTQATPEFNEQLKDFTDFIEFYQNESFKLIESWGEK